MEEKEGGQHAICRDQQGSNPGCMYLVPGALAPGIFCVFAKCRFTGRSQIDILK
jgi:hypothetical protein